MVMQQAFRLIFGAANVQVNNPGWLMGNLSFGEFQMSYTRLFIMLLALVVIISYLGSAAQNQSGSTHPCGDAEPQYGEQLGIPVARVNSMTFALGCGLGRP